MNKIFDHKPEEFEREPTFDQIVDSTDRHWIGFGFVLGILVALAITAFRLVFAGHA